MKVVNKNELGVCEGKSPVNDVNYEQTASELFDKYGNSIYQLAYSCLYNAEDAEDVLQETLIRYLEKRPTFSDQRHGRSWLLKVAFNISKDILRRRKILEVCELRDDMEAESRDDSSYIWEAVGSLPVDCREVFHLYYHEGYSTGEIAEILGMKAATVRSHLKRGRKRLQEILGKDISGGKK